MADNLGITTLQTAHGVADSAPLDLLLMLVQHYALQSM